MASYRKPGSALRSAASRPATEKLSVVIWKTATPLFSFLEKKTVARAGVPTPASGSAFVKSQTVIGQQLCLDFSLPKSQSTK
jgi:hypothetical protein